MIDLLNEIYESNITILLDGTDLKLGFKDEVIDEVLITRIKENKQEIVSYLSKYTSSNKQNNIARVETQESYEVSSSQLRMLYSIFTDADSKGFNYAVPNSIHLKQDINIVNFKQAVYSTIERHESLRTVFRINEEGQIRQYVLEKEAIDFAIDFLDLRTLDKAKEIIHTITKGDVKRPFDIGNGPLIRVKLFQLQDNEFIFYCNIHHVISDSWSLDILFKDIFAFYSSSELGIPVDLPELNIQYKDYAVWQNEQLSKGLFKSQEAYFKNTFSGEIPVLNFTNSKNRPAVKTVNGLALKSYLSKETTTLFNKFCSDKKGSVFMGLLAVWNILLYKYTNSTDIIIGTAVAGRDHADLKGQIGCYINSLPLRNQIDPEQTFNTFFDTVKENTLNALNCQFYPFNHVLKLIDYKTDMARSPLFDVMLLLQNAVDNSQHYDVDETQIKTIKQLGGTSVLTDLDINFVEEGDYLCCNLVYNTDVFEPEYATGLLTHFKQLIEEIVSEPNVPIRKIDYLFKEEKEELLFEFNDTQAEYSKNSTIVDLFEEKVNTIPNSIALVFKDKEFTYKELDEQSNKLANYLLSNYKIETEDLVAVQLERSEWMIISLLAVLKTGGAYLPIDPNYPKERISYLNEDSNCKITVDENLIEKFKSNIDLYSNELPKINLNSDNLIYVIYTSGSTGNPKGVMITHKNAVSFLQNTDYDLNFKDYRVIAGTTNVVFDISFLEIFGSLCSGKKLVFLSLEELMVPELFVKTLNKNKVDVLQITPSRFNQIFNFLPITNLQYVKQLLIGGEAFPKKLFDTISLYPNINIVNVYGPTETTIWSTSLDIKKNDRLSIGKPLHNESIYILSDYLELQPKGVVGEICIGGDGLARGYLNRPELTKEKFINNPFAEGRIYRTGDLGRWLPDGNIECVGRKDDQIKVNGHRVELGEIETVIEMNSLAEKAVVQAKEIGGNISLVAYLVNEKEIDKKELRDTLKKFLPDYMVPSYYIQIKKFLLTATGKIDKKSLPDLSKGDSIKNEYVAPRTDLEKKLVSIWEEVLGIENIGITDDFFSLGGDSIKSITVFSKLRQYGYALHVRDIILNPKLEDLIPYLQKNEKITNQSGVNEISALMSNRIADNYLDNNKASDFQTTPNQEFILGMTMSQGIIGPVITPRFASKEDFLKEFKSFIEVFPILRTQFYKESELIKQRILPSSEVKIDVYQEVQINQEHIASLLSEPFDVIEGALVRVLLIQDANDESNQNSYAYISIHHALTDAFTNTILLKNLRAYFNAQPVETNYVSNFDFAKWQHSFLQSAEGSRHRDYWLETLKNIIRKDKNDTISNGFQDCVQQTAWIAGDEFKNFSSIINRAGLTPSAFFIALHQLILYKHSDKVLQLILVKARELRTKELESHKILGVVNNFLPLPVLRPSDTTKKTYVKAVFSTYMDALMHEQIPYEIICRDMERMYDVSVKNVIGGLVNFINNEKEKQFATPVVQNTINYSKNDFTQGIDLVCNAYSNAVEITISCSLEKYNNLFSNDFDFKNYLHELIEELI